MSDNISKIELVVPKNAKILILILKNNIRSSSAARVIIKNVATDTCKKPEQILFDKEYNISGDEILPVQYPIQQQEDSDVTTTCLEVTVISENSDIEMRYAYGY